MSQSEWLGAVLIAGFLVWLAMTKRLAVYWSILTGGAAQASPASSTSSTATPSSGSTASGVSSGPVAPAGDPPTVTQPPSTTSQQPFRIEIPVPMFPMH